MRVTFGVSDAVAATWVSANVDAVALVELCRVLCHHVTVEGRVELLSTPVPAFDGATVGDVLASGGAPRALEVYRAALVW